MTVILRLLCTWCSLQRTPSCSMPLSSHRGESHFPSLHGGSVLCDRLDVRDILIRRQYHIRFLRTRVNKSRSRTVIAASQSPYSRDGCRASLFCTVSFFAALRSCLSCASQRRMRSSHFTLAYAPLAESKARQISTPSSSVVAHRFTRSPEPTFLDCESSLPRPGAVAGRHRPSALGRCRRRPRKPFWFLYTRR